MLKMEVDPDQEISKKQLFSSAKELYDQLRLEWYKKSTDLDKCGDLLSQLKVFLIDLTFLPTFPIENEASTDELALARSVLEIGVEWSIAMKDIPSFERYMSQLKCYYLDYKNKLPESTEMYPLLGLNLLFLLSQNRVAEFHTELELLPPDKIQNNIYIKHSVSLEQYLMEGRYSKVFVAAHIVPSPSYHFFMNILLETIRNEIAECLEKAYTEISVADTTFNLNLPNTQAAIEFGQKRNWTLSKDGKFTFTTQSEAVEEEDALPDYKTLVDNMLQYAKEMESIV